MNTSRFTPRAAVALGIYGLAMYAPLIGAQTTASSTNSDVSLEEVVVTGLRGSLQQSLNLKKDSVGVLDSISAEDIGKFPDLNLSESLQRIPGVSISRSDLGEGTVIDVRGLGDAFNRVEIDGMASNGGGFNFQSIASELFQTATVAKSPSASMVEGGIGGAVLLETPQPLSYDGLKVNGVVEGVTGDMTDDFAPRAFARISNNWNDTFGLSAAVAYSETKFATNDTSFGSWARFRDVASPATQAAAPAELLNAVTPRTIAYYSYTEERDNWAGTLAAQFRPSDTVEMAFNAIYADSRGARHDDRPDVPIEDMVAMPTSYTIEDGAVVSGVFPHVQNRIGTSKRPRQDELLQTTFQLDWRPNDNWRISPFLGFVSRETLNELRLYSFAINDATVSYQFAGKDFPNFTSNLTDFSSNPEDYGFNIFIFDSYRVKDENLSAKLDFERTFEDSALTSVQFGARYSDLTSDTGGTAAYLLQGSPVLAGRPSTLDAAFRYRDFHVRGAPGNVPSRILAVDTDRVEDVFMGGVNPYTADGFARSPNDTALRTYEVTQRTTAGYVQGNADFGRAQMNFGVRVVRTDVTSDGSQLIDNEVSSKKVDSSYTNVLPSFNLKLDVADQLIMRATYSRTMERPGLFSLRPSTTIESGTRTGSRGNPDLDPYTADQGDIGLEWYFHQGAVLAGTLFVKKLDSLISERTTEELTTFPDQETREPVQGVIAFTEPVNGDRASIQGAEVSLQTPFYFLPGGWSDFGTLLNYTYTHSKTKLDDASATTIPGVSSNSYNAILYYDNNRLSSRLSYAWRGEYLQTNAVAAVGGALRYVKPFGQLDLSASYKLTDSLNINLHVLNLLKEQRLETTRIKGRSDLQSHMIEMERRIILGMHMSF
ncbi:MAG TPA: TonB-dependent receptor [Steroidobacter sp.]|uniref:TonB-dependent receptor n=1 Tax=Steroidobacter sp. TaxID=1978227 RepID=UPI002ED82E28